MTAVSADAIRAETITITGNGGDQIEAYCAVPLAKGSRGGVVWIHHMPGYDRETKEFVRRLAASGYHTVCPNLYSREAPGAEPDDAAAERAEVRAYAERANAKALLGTLEPTPAAV